MHLTVAYITSRRQPRIEWFYESLMLRIRECHEPPTIRVVVVDFHHGTRKLPKCPVGFRKLVKEFLKVPPKPCVWQGPHRLTKEDYFAAANARNTALCLAPDGWIAYVDDLSVLMPGWLEGVKQAIAGEYVVQGAYKKVRLLRSETAQKPREVVWTWDEFDGGIDSRWKLTNGYVPLPSTPNWLYGCSCAMPVEALLKVNGWVELGDTLGMGGEDYLTGILIGRNDYSFKYDRSMLTLESEEDHHIEPPLKRVIEHLPPRADASVELLNQIQNSAITSHPGYADIREMRNKVLNGESFPIVQIPEHNWYSGKALSEY